MELFFFADHILTELLGFPEELVPEGVLLLLTLALCLLSLFLLAGLTLSADGLEPGDLGVDLLVFDLGE